MFCAKCGAELESGSKFCYVCGAKQEEVSDPKVVSMPESTVMKTVGVFSNNPVQESRKSVEIPLDSNNVENNNEISAAKLICIKPGTVLHNRYTVGQVLGHGGFGITYVGKDNSLQMKVAIKEFFPRAIVTRNNTVSENVECLNDKELFDSEKSKVINEARILAKFSKTPGIVNVIDYFEENNTAYIVMEYLEGQTLKEYVSANGVLPADKAFSLLKPIMNVLELLHKENVIHRDISPDNIMFDGEQVKLLDFGAARELLGNTSDGLSVVLKHGYAPQEQYSRSGNQGPWTDIYSLCATIYFCLTGKAPVSSMDRIKNDPLKKPSEFNATITPAKEKVLLQGLEVFPECRFPNVASFITAWEGTPNTITGRSDSYKGNIVSGPVVKNEKTDDNKKRITKPIIIASSILATIILIICISLIVSKTTDSDDNGKTDTTAGYEETDSTTEKIEEKIQEYIDKANAYAADGNYAEAFASLDTAKQLYGSSKIIDEARISIEKKQLLSQIEELESSGKIGDAILAIDNSNSSIKKDNEIVQKRNSLKQSYIPSVISSADAALKSNGYEAAINIIDEALKIVPSEQELLNKKTEYEAYKPVDLFSLDYFNAADNFGFEYNDPQERTDNEGNAHPKTYSFKHDFYHSNTWVEYKLGKKYNKLSGTFFLDYEWRTTKQEAHFYVYGDGKLLYDGIQTGGKVPFDFNIDITNVDVLRIEYKTDIWTSSGFTHSVFAGIFDNTYIVKTK